MLFATLSYPSGDWVSYNSYHVLLVFATVCIGSVQNNHVLAVCACNCREYISSVLCITIFANRTSNTTEMWPKG